MSLLSQVSGIRAALAAVASTLPLVDGDNSVAHAAAYPAGFRTWTLEGGRERPAGFSPSSLTAIGQWTVDVRVYTPQAIGPGLALAELEALGAAFVHRQIGSLHFHTRSGPYLGADADPDCPPGMWVAGIGLEAELIDTRAAA